MIEASHITFEYPGKRALKDVSFTIEKGSITALVGPNGAGKTTLMRCIAALDDPFSGTIYVDGIGSHEKPREIHRRIGYLSDFFGLYNDLTVKQSLTYIASIHKMDAHQQDKRIKEISGLLGLDKYINAGVGTLSRGWRQRVGIAQAIVHNPSLLLLDEPASGLDPEARKGLSNLFLALAEQGMTLVVSSHILAELEDYCTDMLLLRNGRMIEHRASTEQKNALILVITLTEAASKHLAKIKKMAGVENPRADKRQVECLFAGDEKAKHLLLAELLEKKVPVSDFTVKKRRLQDIYMDYAGESV